MLVHHIGDRPLRNQDGIGHQGTHHGQIGEHAGQQHPVGILEFRLQSQGTGGIADAPVHLGHGTFFRIGGAVAEFHGHILEFGAVVGVPLHNIQVIRLGYGEPHPHGITAGNGGEHRGIGRYERPFRQGIGIDLPGERCYDLGIAYIHLGRSQDGGLGIHRSLGLGQLGIVLVGGLFAHCALFIQGLVPGGIPLGIGQGCLGIGQIGLGIQHGVLIVPGIDHIEQLSCFHIIPAIHQLLDNGACYLALDLHIVGRFHEPGVIIGNGGIPSDDLHGLDRHISRRRSRFLAAAGNAYQQKESHPDGYHFFLS